MRARLPDQGWLIPRQARAEDLAEQGILDAYQEPIPHLAEHGVTAGPVTENDDMEDHYIVDFDGQRYLIYGPGTAQEDG